MTGFMEVSQEEMYAIDGGITSQQFWGAVAVISGIAACAATAPVVASVCTGIALAAGAAALFS